MRHFMKWMFLTAAFLGLASSAMAEPAPIAIDEHLRSLIPSAAYDGVGVWQSADYSIATGRTTSSISLGGAKDHRSEQQWAEKDCEHRIYDMAARKDDAGFDENTHDLKGKSSGMQFVATYRIPDQDSFYVVCAVKNDQVHVETSYNPSKAREYAVGLFNQGDYQTAAKYLAELTQKGAQDSETVSYARAAGWHVNLDAGVTGETQSDALQGLEQFYFDKGMWEESLQYGYKLYIDLKNPPANLLQRLADLSQKTNRMETAAKFQKELDRIQGKVFELPIVESTLQEPWVSLLQDADILLSQGGARVLSSSMGRYFIAVGATTVGDETSKEKIRQLRVGRVQAQRAAVGFAEQTNVTVQDSMEEKISGHQEGKDKRIVVEKVLDETTLTQVNGAIKNLEEIGTWKSQDGKMFFFALGIKLD